MGCALGTYLEDHLAGSQYALDLLQDLSEQTVDLNLAQFATRLQIEIENDREILQKIADRIGTETTRVKEMAAWVAQKAGRLKLSMHEPVGRFEAIEMLSLGVLGKLALWDALKTVRSSNILLMEVKFDELIQRAVAQHSELEARRLELAKLALTPDSDS